METPIKDVDYKFNINEHDYTIEILTGQYSGVEYVYNHAAIEELEDEAVLSFEFTILSEDKQELKSKVEFKNYIGSILIDILTKQVRKEEEDESDDIEYTEV